MVIVISGAGARRVPTLSIPVPLDTTPVDTHHDASGSASDPEDDQREPDRLSNTPA